MIIITFYVGACLGSFLLCLADQWVSGTFSFTRRSRCDNCQVTLGVWDLIPFVTQAFFNSRCRNCHCFIGHTYFWSEVISGIVTLYCVYLLPLKPWTLQLVIYTLLLASFCDLLAGWVPDRIQFVLLGLVVIQTLSTDELQFTPFMLAIFYSGLLWIIYYLRRDWLGGADVKTLSILAFVLPVHSFPYLLLAASIFGLFSFLVAYLWRHSMPRSVPFFPAITMSFCCLAYVI